MTEKPIETNDALVAEEEDDHEKNILKTINEKYKDNLAIKLKLLALFDYSKMEQENSEKMSEEIDNLTLKYQKLFAPIVKKQNDVINGRKLEEDEVKNYNEYLESGEEAKKDELLSKEYKNIDGYWLKVLKANLGLKEEIKEYDEEPLKALRRIEYFPSENPEEPYNFSLKFHFAPNDYFENDILIKEFTMVDEREAEKTECTEIKWKEGKDITKKSIKKKQKNKKTGQQRTTTKLVDQDSFFTFFRNMEAKDDEEEEDEEDEEEELDSIDRHVEIGQTIVEEILPYSNEYYLGVRKETDFAFLKQQVDAEGAAEEDDDDEDEDDKKAKKPKKTTKENAGAGGEPKQECKQQ
eukprot:CAMPEP_0176441990 /NCGR_PEP_ID=MMETSP0127-20121128/21543_1 /TAXON_ID=938130 /ORGANISM="Platyophrya macrostoma, Strain WH" /LENGTH=351 /DNA_ID=CAMNT_0017826907 /DNA_START=31 /DNA_END=1086 /DNA_ORIENTATION=+